MNDAHRLTTKSIFGATDAERKACPVFDGFVMYFPRSMAAIARHSAKANEKHNPGEKLHWARGKSTDHLNTALRHLIDAGMGILWDGEYNNMVANGWRTMAALETYLEQVEGIDAVSAAKRDMAIAEVQNHTGSTHELSVQGQVVAAAGIIGRAYEVNKAIDEATEVRNPRTPAVDRPLAPNARVNEKAAEDIFPPKTIDLGFAGLLPLNRIARFPVGSAVRIETGHYKGYVGKVVYASPISSHRTVRVYGVPDAPKPSDVALCTLDLSAWA